MAERNSIMVWGERALAVFAALLALALILPDIGPEQISGQPANLVTIGYVAAVAVPVLLIFVGRVRWRPLRIVGWGFLVLVLITSF